MAGANLVCGSRRCPLGKGHLSPGLKAEELARSERQTVPGSPRNSLCGRPCEGRAQVSMAAGSMSGVKLETEEGPEIKDSAVQRQCFRPHPNGDGKPAKCFGRG